MFDASTEEVPRFNAAVSIVWPTRFRSQGELVEIMGFPLGNPIYLPEDALTTLKKNDSKSVQTSVEWPANDRFLVVRRVIVFGVKGARDRAKELKYELEAIGFVTTLVG